MRKGNFTNEPKERKNFGEVRYVAFIALRAIRNSRRLPIYLGPGSTAIILGFGRQ